MKTVLQFSQESGLCILSIGLCTEENCKEGRRIWEDLDSSIPKKKKDAVILVLMFVFILTGTAMAAPTEEIFSDVPAKHWAYDAVKQLAKAGIVEGDQDGTFRGDRVLSRYEMALIVGNAMTKVEKADAANKALIEKLAKEYDVELSSLKAQVDKLEKRTTKFEEKNPIKFNMENRIRFVGNNPPAGAQRLRGADNFEWRMRLVLSAEIAPDTTFNARLESTGTKFGSTLTTTKGTPVETSNGLKVNRMFLTNKNFLVDQIRIGRMGIAMNQNLLAFKSSNNDGIEIIEKIGDVTFKGGLWDVNPDSTAVKAGGTTSDAQELWCLRWRYGCQQT